MQPGEKRSFIRYLHEQRMYIDLWDGESLMLIGSTSAELKVRPLLHTARLELEIFLLRLDNILAFMIENI